MLGGVLSDVCIICCRYNLDPDKLAPQKSFYLDLQCYKNKYSFVFVWFNSLLPINNLSVM